MPLKKSFIHHAEQAAKQKMACIATENDLISLFSDLRDIGANDEGKVFTFGCSLREESIDRAARKKIGAEWHFGVVDTQRKATIKNDALVYADTGGNYDIHQGKIALYANGTIEVSSQATLKSGKFHTLYKGADIQEATDALAKWLGWHAPGLVENMKQADKPQTRRRPPPLAT